MEEKGGGSTTANKALWPRPTSIWPLSSCSSSLPPHRTVTDPYLNLFRGIIPPLGGTLDLSPILAFVTLNVSALHAPGC